MPAALYARTAALAQGAPDAAVARQTAALRAYCREQGHAVAGEYVDAGYSGLSDRRPALARLRRDVAAGRVDVVVVADRARLSRSPRLFARLLAALERRHVRLICLAEGLDSAAPPDRLLLALSGS